MARIGKKPKTSGIAVFLEVFCAVLGLALLWPGMSARAAVDHPEEFHCIDIDESTQSFMININRVTSELEILAGETTADIVWDKATKTLTLTDVDWERTDDRGPFFQINNLTDVTLVLNGENKLIRTGDFGGEAIRMNQVTGTFTIMGPGTLTIETEGDAPAFAWQNWNDELQQQTHARLKNTATLTISSANPHNDVEFFATRISMVSNSGYVYGRILMDGDGAFLDMVPYTTEYTEQVEHAYADKAYYFESSTAPANPDPRVVHWDPQQDGTPNHIIGSFIDGEAWPCRRIGEYDADGYPILSDCGYWQRFWITNEEWGGSREEENRPTRHLLYGNEEERVAMLTPADKLQIDDGKTYVIDTDLRYLSVSCGNVTMNGNIRFTAIGTSEVVWDGEPDDRGHIRLIRDEDGVPITNYDSSDAVFTINGDVMSLSLSDTFRGDIIMNGSSMMTTYDYELLSEDDVPVDNPGYPSELYAAVKSPGKIVEDGQFSFPLDPFEGWITGASYGEESFTNLSHEVDEEFVHGTQQIIDDAVLTVDLGADGIPEDGFPFVKEADAAEQEKALELLGDENANALVLSISLISEGEKTQPSKEINLYLDGITGFSNPSLYHIGSDGTLEKLYTFSGESFEGKIVAPVNSFSTYFVAEEKAASIYLNRLYDLFFDRLPDTAGKNDWMEALEDHSMSIANVLVGFFQSPELINRGLSNKELVKLVYLTVLDREADAEGLACWTEQLDNGMSLNQLIAGFLSSAEGKAYAASTGLDYGGIYADGSVLSPGLRAFVARMYRIVLGREPESAGFYDWAECVKDQNLSPREIPANFFFSKEYTALNKSDVDFVTDCYRSVLGREPEAEGLKYWTDTLAAGTDRRDVLKGFTDSPEFTNLLAGFGLK